MYKKLIAMIMVFSMLVSISPAVAAENVSAKPTVEEILNEYHQKTLDAQAVQEETSASANSRSVSGSGQTLEQETVEQLTEAGYEAYNVTAENYYALESTLMCDFADLGLDPSGSYIIVISGEESEDGESSNAPTPRDLTLPPHLWDGETPGGDVNWFPYVYNDTTYYMRYFTVTSSDNIEYRDADYADLSAEYCSQFGLDFWDTFFTICLDYITAPIPTSSIASLLGLESRDGYTMNDSTLILHASAKWTRVFIQVYDSDSGWRVAQSSTYVITESYCSGQIYNQYTDEYDRFEGDEEIETHYSPNYFNEEIRKQSAVLAYLQYSIDHDSTGNILFSHHGSIVLRLYEPFDTLTQFPTD